MRFVPALFIVPMTGDLALLDRQRGDDAVHGRRERRLAQAVARPGERGPRLLDAALDRLQRRARTPRAACRRGGTRPRGRCSGGSSSRPARRRRRPARGWRCAAFAVGHRAPPAPPRCPRACAWSCAWSIWSRKSPFFTRSPSCTARFRIWPITLAEMSTLRFASTLPLAPRATTTSSRATVCRSTGVPFFPRLLTFRPTTTPTTRSTSHEDEDRFLLHSRSPAGVCTRGGRTAREGRGGTRLIATANRPPRSRRPRRRADR